MPGKIQLARSDLPSPVLYTKRRSGKGKYVFESPDRKERKEKPGGPEECFFLQ